MVSLNSVSSWVDEIDPSQFSCVFKMDLFLRPLLLLHSAWHSFPYSPRVLAVDDLAWMSAVFSLISPWITYFRLDVFLQKEKNCVKPVQGSDKFRDPSIIPIIIDALLLLDIQIRMNSSGYINVFQLNRE